MRAQDSRKKNDSPRGLTQEAMSAIAGNNCHLMNSHHMSDTLWALSLVHTPISEMRR